MAPPLLNFLPGTFAILVFAYCMMLLLSYRTSAIDTRNQTLAYVYWRNATVVSICSCLAAFFQLGSCQLTRRNQPPRSQKRTAGSVVPRPKQISYTNALDYLEIKPLDFKLELVDPRLSECPGLALAVRRYQRHTYRLLFDDFAAESKDDPSAGKRRKLGYLKSVRVFAPDKFVCDPEPHANMDEAYRLRVEYNVALKLATAKLEAHSNWGFLRGLETLSQLIFRRLDSPTESGESSFGIQPVQIVDEPRFKHRAFMLDTARHYISVKNIKLMLEAMSYNKLNVFHWHIVDDQSFALESLKYPELTKSAAFRPNLIYTQEQVKEIVNYASMLGIRVVPELDTPGHSYPLRHIAGVLSECYDTKSRQKSGDFGPIDPTSSTAYETVDLLLAEFGTLFKDSYFHAGGDEVDFDCWRSSPNITRWMKARNITGDYGELSNIYIRRLYDMLTLGHNKTMLAWQEVYDLGAWLPRDRTIIHVWKDINNKSEYMAELKRVVDSGYNALLSSCWYLNYIDYGQDWIKFYQCDPRGAPLDRTKAHQVLGGEICMWTEFVDDTNVLSRTWPRATAAAERLWSPMDVNNTEEFLHRLEQHRCRLLARGINAEPVNGPGYC